tara:strand:+ start:42 stop:182 length:141 start_codon:yes stop_codon:yes gene_type:complete
MKFTPKELEIVTRALRVLSVEIADENPVQAKEINNLRIILQTKYEE